MTPILRPRARRHGQALVCSLLLSLPMSAGAQEPPLRRLEVQIGGGWFGGATLGGRDAHLRQNTSPPSSLPLFSVDTRLAGAPLLAAGVGVAVTRRWGIEAGVGLSRPELRASVRADADGAPAIAIAERVDQYVVEGRLVVLLEEMRLGRDTIPFVTAGAGYLRQLHEGLTVVNHGHVFHVGGGVKHWLAVRDHGLVRAAGLRADARLYLLAGGVAFDDRPRPHGAISGAVFVAF